MKRLLCILLALLCLTVSAFAEDLVLNTTDLDGQPFTNEQIAGASVVLVNFWEPWCGPCVREIPELEKLYETYADRGLLILGVFITGSMADDVRDLVEEDGVTYPILNYTADMKVFQSGYVPNTILTDGEGHLLTEEPIAGARSYEAWEALVLPYLQPAADEEKAQ